MAIQSGHNDSKLHVVLPLVSQDLPGLRHIGRLDEQRPKKSNVLRLRFTARLNVKLTWRLTSRLSVLLGRQQTAYQIGTITQSGLML